MEDVNKLPDKLEWIDNFLQSKKYSDAQAEITKIRLNNCVFFDNESFTYSFNNVTIRHEDLMFGKLDIQPFYILDYISNQNNDIIYDIGCGYNFFKKFYNIVGIDPNDKAADIKDTFNKEFAEKYRGKFENAITINAIHFCNIAQFPLHVDAFINLVKPNGYVYIAINVIRLLEKTDIDFTLDLVRKKPITDQKLIPILESYRNNLIDFKNLSTYFHNIVSKLEDHVVYYEDMLEQNPNESLNGNIRILIKRKK